MITRIEITDKEKWNGAIKELPGVGILQTWEWGQVKQAYGWQPKYFLWLTQKKKVVAAAAILFKDAIVPIIKWSFRTAYIPQGPLLNWSDVQLRDQILKEIHQTAEEAGAVFLKIDPEVIMGFDEEIQSDNKENFEANEVLAQLEEFGYQFSSQQIQFKNTAWLKLNLSEDELLKGMKQKTRYNVRLAGRKGVVVRQGSLDDLETLYQMYLETSIRDGFIIRPKDYYTLVWSTFMKEQMAVPLIAEVEGQPIAGLMLFHFANRSWYLYGMSTSAHREKMPNYLLQWQAIKISKQLGCEIYDLWGAPDEFTNADGMWGVYRFKKGLGAHAVQRIGAYDLPLKKNAYKIFIEIIPRIQVITRKIRKVQQLQELN